MKPGGHYTQEGSFYLIEIHADETEELFHPLDPSPFKKRDLHEDVERYIIDSMHDFRTNDPVKLVITLPANDLASKEAIDASVRHHFGYLADREERQLRETLRTGRFALAVGGSVLIVCVALANLLQAASENMFAEITAEALFIGGWVAMWRPIETFLYDWWPLRNNDRLYRRIAQMPIDITAV